MAHHATRPARRRPAPADPRGAARAARETRAPAQRRARTAARSTSRRSTCSGGSRSRSPGSSGRWIRRSADRPRSPRRGRPRPDLRGRAARRPPERGDADPDRDQGPLHRAARRRPGCARSRRRASSRRARSRSWPTRTSCCRSRAATRASATRSSSRTCAGSPVPRPPASMRIAVFTAATDAFTGRNIGMTVEESLAAFAPVLARAGELGWWRRGYVSTAFGCPYTGRGRPGPRGRGRAAAARARCRRGLLRRHDRRRRPGPGRGADRAGRGGRHPARADRLPLPRHARDGAGQRRRRARRRGPLLRFVDRWDRRLPVRPGRRGQPRHGGPRLLPRRVRLGARRLARGVLDAARFIADALGRPLATKVGQAGGWDPATGAADGRG